MRIPEEYKCANCGAKRCKLWRPYNSSDVFLELLCAKCAMKKEEKLFIIDTNGEHSLEDHRDKTDNIGRYVRAIPDGRRGVSGSYWAYTEEPDDDFNWWRQLPTYPL